MSKKTLSPRRATAYDVQRQDKATMASTTEEVLRRHVKCFFEGDLEGIVSDYSADAVLFTPSGPLKGHDPIREFFRALIREFGQPGTTFSMHLQSIDGDFAYALWSAETADNVYEMATDTQVVRDGKIVAQSFASQIKPKR
jgi:ketosteroid isomerase-like protein